jgi:ELWxxDGT repeat protein
MKNLKNMKNIVLIISVLVGLNINIKAQVPSLVKDINTVGGYNVPGKYCTVNNITYFIHDDEVHGPELWRTEGTNANTYIVKEIKTGSEGSMYYNSDLVEFKGELYFLAENDFGFGLWKSNGTESGTILIKNFGSRPDFYYLPNMTNCGEYLVFANYTTATGLEPWRSDGTTNGTTILADINPGTISSQINEISFAPFFGGNIFFTISNVAGKSGIWQCSYSCFLGCSALTVPTKIPNTKTAKNLFNTFNTTTSTFDLYFRDSIQSVKKMNISTNVITNIATFSIPSMYANKDYSFKDFNNSVYFSGYDAVNGVEMWKTDGTAAGTSLFKNINTTTGSNNSSFVYNMTVCNNALYFGADDGVNGRELWKTDGTIAGTLMIADILTGSEGSRPYEFQVIGTKFYFKTAPYDYDNAKLQLRFFDTSNSQFTLLKDFTPVPYIETSLDVVLLNQTLIFSGYNPTSGFEVWKSDGTIAGTNQIKDISQGSSGARDFVTLNSPSVTYFTAYNGTDNNLWLTDLSGLTYKINAAKPFVDYSENRTSSMALGSNLIFSGYSTNNLGVELWKSNGSEAGTTLIKDINIGSNPSNPSNFCMAGNTIFFTANDAINGEELWITDGTTTGTELVKDIYPGPGDSSPSNLTLFNGFVYFSAYDGSNRGLWRSNGTALGTSLIQSFINSNNPTINNLTVANNKLFFAANEYDKGVEIWVSDGTTAGTSMIKDIRAGSQSSNPRYLTAVGNLVYFSADNGLNGRELWRTDGTNAGTLMTNINPEHVVLGTNVIENSNPANLTAVGNNLFFSAESSNFSNATYPYFGRELYAINGGFTYMVKDANINPNTLDGISSNFTDKFAVKGGTVFYPGTDGIHGTELWRSNGSGTSTFMVNDQFLGSNDGMVNSSKMHVNTGAGKLYYGNTDGQNGRELWDITFCPLSVNINSTIQTNIQKQQAAQTLISNCNISTTGLTYGNLNVQYTASKSITLQPGFSVEGIKLPQNRKSVFEAKVSGCIN